MPKLVYETNISLDGFMMAANVSAAAPLGEGGERLHEWGMGRDIDPRNRELLARLVESVGAHICGRTMYDASLPWWGPDGPTGSLRQPVFVVTHRRPDDPPAGGVYVFVTDGIESALQQATAAADGRDVAVSGKDVAEQFIRAGLVDELSIHVVPVLFGSGTRVLEHVTDEHVELEIVEVTDTPTVTHLRYRIANRRP
jgi:dihydrofolate reductase